MLWAIDVGNTQTVVGVWDGHAWRAHWRMETDSQRTEDEIAAFLAPLADLSGLRLSGEGAIVASVVPSADENWTRFAKKYLGQEARFLRDGASVSLTVEYSPPTAVGADRVANALGALLRTAPPLIVVDFGTATTLDCVDAKGHYVGGAIMPGLHVSLQSLVGRTAKLPSVAIEAPPRVIGRDTVSSLQSGVVLGYAGAIDRLVTGAARELGETVSVIATGGLGSFFVDLCESIDEYDAHLTLDGLKEAWRRLV